MDSLPTDHNFWLTTCFIGSHPEELGIQRPKCEICGTELRNKQSLIRHQRSNACARALARNKNAGKSGRKTCGGTIISRETTENLSSPTPSMAVMVDMDPKKEDTVSEKRTLTAEDFGYVSVQQNDHG